MDEIQSPTSPIVDFHSRFVGPDLALTTLDGLSGEQRMAASAPSIGHVRQVLRAVAAWCLASPASTYVFTPPPHENANARAARIRRDQDAVNQLFEPPDPYDTWRRL
jgi:hypothetical protein